ncbi:MAG: RNA polymerase sigma-54 factor, partial [Brevundimonas sp.]
GEPGGDGPAEPVEAPASGDNAELQFTEPSGEAEQAMDARTEDLYDDAPGERDADRKRDAGEAGEQPGLSDWSRAGSGGGMDSEGIERPDTRDLTLWEHLQAQASAAGFTPADHAIAL